MIVFSSVTKTFGNSPTGIVDFSLEVKDGDLITITGPSGAGKTTLMKLLIREYLPDSGEIVFDEQSLGNLKNSQIPGLRQKIGVVFQDYKLISDMNVWENIALPLYVAGQNQAEIESRVTDLLKLVELTDKAHHFPSQLSGGEAQRISIARALATGPRVIFADEPTGNLDSETALRITRLLKKINELGTTLLLATHNEAVIEALGKSKIIHLKKIGPEGHAEESVSRPVEEKAENSSKTKKKKLSLTDEKTDSKIQKEAEAKVAEESEKKSPAENEVSKETSKKKTWQLPFHFGKNKKEAAISQPNSQKSKETEDQKDQEDPKEELL
jgi:cell division transport system ATP-binding protein